MERVYAVVLRESVKAGGGRQQRLWMDILISDRPGWLIRDSKPLLVWNSLTNGSCDVPVKGRKVDQVCVLVLSHLRLPKHIAGKWFVPEFTPNHTRQAVQLPCNCLPELTEARVRIFPKGLVRLGPIMRPNVRE